MARRDSQVSKPRLPQFTPEQFLHNLPGQQKVLLITSTPVFCYPPGVNKSFFKASKTADEPNLDTLQYMLIDEQVGYNFFNPFMPCSWLMLE